MNKKEAHEIWLTLNEVCVEHKDCIGCPFYIIFGNRQCCAVNHKRSNDVGHILFNAAYGVQSPSALPKRLGTIIGRDGVFEQADEKLSKVLAKAGSIIAQEINNTKEDSPMQKNIFVPSINAKHDNVNSPKHYCKGGLECIEVIKAQLTPEQNKGYLYGNVLKYMWRWPDKNGLEDLRKAEHYLKWLIDEVEKNGGNRKEVKN